MTPGRFSASMAFNPMGVRDPAHSSGCNRTSFSAVVPVTYGAEEEEEEADPEAASSTIPLGDVNMIVIGRGPIAEELVRRRRLVGGRVCWLWTERFPLARAPMQDPATDLQPQHAAAEQHRDTHVEEGTSAWAERATDSRWDISKFVWKPLGHEQRSSCGQQVWYSARLEKLRQRFGTSHTTWRTTGPDIVHFDSHEEYLLIGGRCDGRAPGIQVLDSRNPALGVLWEVSGKVMFAGQQFQDSVSNLLTTTISSEADASKIEMNNLHEETKPFVTVNATHFLVWSAVCFVEFAIFYTLMATYEKHMRPGDVPWWRASFLGLTIAPFGYSSFPDFFALSLTGRQLEGYLACLLSVIAILSKSVACVVPRIFMSGQWLAPSIFVAACIAFAVYTSISLLAAAFSTSGRPYARNFRCGAHALWFVWMLFGTLGTSILLYGVSIAYIVLQQTSLVAASLFLPIITSMVEIGTLMTTVWIYRRFVYASRMHASNQVERPCSMLGDQKMVMMIALCVTHAYSESARLVSLLVPVVKQPSWSFFFPMLSCFLSNVCLRCFLSTELVSRTVSPSWWFLVLPDAGTVMLNEVRVCFGYPRFVNLAALAFSNVVVHGLERWPLFNFHASVFVLLACALEMIEDLIVCRGWLTATSWMHKTSSYYRGMHPLSLSQVMSFDKDGVQPSGFAIGFHGMRHLPFRCVAVVMVPSGMFVYFLMTLFLGAGFIHSACPTSLAENGRLIDSLLWETPLRC